MSWASNVSDRIPIDQAAVHLWLESNYDEQKKPASQRRYLVVTNNELQYRTLGYLEWWRFNEENNLKEAIAYIGNNTFRFQNTEEESRIANCAVSILRQIYEKDNAKKMNTISPAYAELSSLLKPIDLDVIHRAIQKKDVKLIFSVPGISLPKLKIDWTNISKSHLDEAADLQSEEVLFYLIDYFTKFSEHFVHHSIAKNFTLADAKKWIGSMKNSKFREGTIQALKKLPQFKQYANQPPFVSEADSKSDKEKSATTTTAATAADIKVQQEKYDFVVKQIEDAVATGSTQFFEDHNFKEFQANPKVQDTMKKALVNFARSQKMTKAQIALADRIIKTLPDNELISVLKEEIGYEGNTTFAVMCKLNQRELVASTIAKLKDKAAELCTKGNFDKKTPLHLAAENNNVDIVQTLLAVHPRDKLNVKDKDGMTPFFRAIVEGHTDVLIPLRDHLRVYNEFPSKEVIRSYIGDADSKKQDDLRKILLR